MHLNLRIIEKNGESIGIRMISLSDLTIGEDRWKLLMLLNLIWIDPCSQDFLPNLNCNYSLSSSLVDSATD